MSDKLQEKPPIVFYASNLGSHSVELYWMYRTTVFRTYSPILVLMMVAESTV